MHYAAILLTFVTLAGTASAWHRGGHFTVARIAWLQLDDGQRAQIGRLLKIHPHYAIYLKQERPPEVSEVEWAFLRASIWSDWIRYPSGPELTAEMRSGIVKNYNKPVWHYVDLPYIHPNDAGKFDEPAIRKMMLEPEFDDKGEPRHVLAALKLASKRLQSAEASPKERAVSLCWLSHLVGDLHQPLHGTGLIASKASFDPPFLPPDADQGGNLLAVKIKPGDAAAVKLHFFWDALLFPREPTYADVEAMVVKLLKEKNYQRAQLPELAAPSFLAWAEESLALAKSTVYQGKDGFLKAYALAPKQRVNLVGLAAPALPEGYQQRADAVAARRMVLAGYRLADQLHLAFPRTGK